MPCAVSGTVAFDNGREKNAVMMRIWNESGWTAFHEAAYSWDPDSISELLSQDGDAQTRTTEPWTIESYQLVFQPEPDVSFSLPNGRFVEFGGSDLDGKLPSK